MQLRASSSVEEVAAIVSDALTSAGITAVLSGGAAVQIYTRRLYQPRDFDFVASASQRELEQVLNRLGFTREAGRHFVHQTCPYTLEFPTWPLAVGKQIGVACRFLTPAWAETAASSNAAGLIFPGIECGPTGRR